MIGLAGLAWRTAMLTGWRRAGYVAATALTYSRPALGLASGLAMTTGNVATALLWYLVGQVTDTVDGFLARTVGVASERGKDWDAFADALLNGLFGLGLMAAAIQPPENFLVIVLVPAMGVGFALSRSQVHTVLDKVLSGVWRVGMYVLACSQLPREELPAFALLGAGFGVVGGLYELRVSLYELAAGERKLFARDRGRELLSDGQSHRSKG